MKAAAPARWPRVRGHDAQIQLFRRIVADGRLAHAYLFLGPEGVGKRRFGMELAKVLNCEAPGAAEQFVACDACSACKQIESGNHPDVELLGLPEGKNEFPIEEIRGLIGRINLKPARGGRRVILLDDAGALSEPAANAFLKTLEEPPPHSLLILIGEQADHFPVTIVSRCQRVRFLPLAAEHLEALLQEQGLAPHPAEARQLAVEAQGSLGLARLLADPAVRQFRQEWLAGFTQVRLDSVAQAKRLSDFVNDAGTESAEKRARALLVLRFLVELLRQALGHAEGLPAPAGPAQHLAATLGTRRLLQLQERVLEAEQQVQRYLQLELVLEALVDALCQPLQPARR